MPIDTPALNNIATATAKSARWEVQRRISLLALTPCNVGLVGMGLNALRRRPAGFPSAHFARFRREVTQQAARAPLTGADLAVVKFRAELLGSPIDARHSKALTAEDLDVVAREAISDAERLHNVLFDESMTDQVFNAVWAQAGDFYGVHSTGRDTQVAAAAGFAPTGGPALAKRLSDIEQEMIARVREHTTQR